MNLLCSIKAYAFALTLMSALVMTTGCSKQSPTNDDSSKLPANAQTQKAFDATSTNNLERQFWRLPLEDSVIQITIDMLRRRDADKQLLDKLQRLLRIRSEDQTLSPQEESDALKALRQNGNFNRIDGLAVKRSDEIILINAHILVSGKSYSACLVKAQNGNWEQICLNPVEY